MANNQPIIFDLKYTPYSLSKKASDYERNKNATERAFYDMSGEKNVYDYITTEGKRVGNKFTALEYLQKSTGVFNQSGMIPQEEVDVKEQKLAALIKRTRLGKDRHARKVHTACQKHLSYILARIGT